MSHFNFQCTIRWIIVSFIPLVKTCKCCNYYKLEPKNYHFDFNVVDSSCQLSSLINKAFTVLGTSSPSDILTHFQKEFDLRMQVNQGTPQMYGFDAAILTVDAQTKTIEFAGARGDLFLVRDGVTHTFRGSRASIDLMPRDARKTTKTPYERHVIDYLPGDQFYMISDQHFIRNNENLLLAGSDHVWVSVFLEN